MEGRQHRDRLGHRCTTAVAVHLSERLNRHNTSIEHSFDIHKSIDARLMQRVLPAAERIFSTSLIRVQYPQERT